MSKTPATAKATTVRVANHHTAPIYFLRETGLGQVARPPLFLPPGLITEVAREEWDELLKSQSTQNYLDKGLIAVTRAALDAEVPTKEESSSDLQVPDHLRTDEEEQEGNLTRAKVRRKKPGVIEV